MHSRPRQPALLAALSVTFLISAAAQVAAQSQSPPADANAAASQAALAIAGVAALKPPDASAASTPESGAAAIAPASAASTPPSARTMTPEQRQQLMRLLILRETSRNPIGYPR